MTVVTERGTASRGELNQKHDFAAKLTQPSVLPRLKQYVRWQSEIRRRIKVLPNLDMNITAQGPGPGAAVALTPCSTKFSVVGYDENASGIIDLTDFAIFATDYGAGNLRSDYNWDSVMNLTDFALFAAHYLKSFTGQ